MPRTAVRRLTVLLAGLCSALALGAWTSDDPSVDVLEDPALPHHTIYAPKDLGATAKLPLVVWDGGGCISPGIVYSPFLSELAAHGYLVVADNAPLELRLSSKADLVAAIDWAQAGAGLAGGRFAGHLDATHVAAAGHSCGGIQALLAAQDERVDTAIPFDSGFFDVPALGGTKDDVDRLRTPVLWVNGGPSDIAYANAETDFARARVPAVWANLDVGHLGTFFFTPKGGEFARIAELWLDWHLKGEWPLAAEFLGPACGLCGTGPDGGWTVADRNW